jgi:aspartyl-tRNA(Asn)/glutamyl-tRNA(Gln) amidotransferase subunit B
MRSKEEAHDYRYFPDPDLPPVAVSEERIAALRAALPELPAAKRERWQKELGVTEYDARVLSGHPEIAKYFEQATRLFVEQSGKKGKDAGKKVANFVQAEVLRHVTTDGLAASFPVAPGAIAELLGAVEEGTINGKIAKKVFAVMVETGSAPNVIIEEQGLAQVTDTGAIEEEVRRILDASPSQVAQYKDGKTNVIGYFVGQVMKATKGAANPKAVNEILLRLLDEQ